MPSPVRIAAPAVVTAALAAPAPAPAACPTPEPGASATIVRQIQGLRAGAGLPRLAVRPPIARPARVHSIAMARTGRLWHDDLRAWSGGALAGQNVAEGPTALTAFGAMTVSAPHRAALLSPRFRAIGVGAVRGCDGMLMVTVNLLGPRVG